MPVPVFCCKLSGESIMNLLLTGCFRYTADQFERLRSLGCCIHFMQQEGDSLPLPAAAVDAAVCNGLFLSHDISAFTGLKFIQLTSAGYDRVPVGTIGQRGIELHNARGVYSTPMAEWTVFRVLEHYKQGWFFRREQTAGCWVKHRGLRELYGRKLAVVGAGSVGREVAKRFRDFGVATTGFDIRTDSTPYFDDILPTGELGNRISDYDIVVVTAPLLPSTRGLFSKEILGRMKEGATLVNVSRGALIEEEALCEVLSERKDLFAALDVFVGEPLPPESPLWKLDNVALSPHNSFVSDGNSRRMFEVIYSNLKDFINKRK